MSDKVQPGVKIDPELWQRFREDVKRRHGSVRNHLRDNLENAIRDYLRVSDEPTPNQLDARLQRIEAAVGASPTDGGTDTFDEPEHTHTPEPSTPTEKPASRASTEKKVAWLAECVTDSFTNGFQEIPPSRLADVVKSEYGFRADTAERYVDLLIDHFDLVDHPHNNTILVTPDRREELIEQRREQLQDDTDTDDL